MFENLTDKFTATFKKLRGQGTLSERNIEQSLKEIRTHLLEADVNYSVAKEFIGRIRQQALGEKVMRSLSPGQQFVKIVHQELVNLLGEQSSPINLRTTPPAPIMLVGLQGSGKTTSAGKIAVHLAGQGRKPYLVPADVYRPAAIDQLKILARQIGVPVFDSSVEMDPVDICIKARDEARINGYDVMIIDTAGRLHINEELMDELKRIKEKLSPSEILLVADAMTGQDAVTVAEAFNSALALTGVLLTKLDGDARGGAALSIKSVTGTPIKLVGVGEKLEALEVFHPERMASRILDMGDIMSLVEKAEAAFDEAQAREMEKKMRKNQFTLEDFQTVLQEIKKMGPLENIMGMIPGARAQMKQIKNFQPAEDELKKIEAIINSMTVKERRNYQIIDGGRRRRIANGSGTIVQDVNRLLKQYQEMRKMMKKMSSVGALKALGMGKGLPF